MKKRFTFPMIIICIFCLLNGCTKYSNNEINEDCYLGIPINYESNILVTQKTSTDALHKVLDIISKYHLSMSAQKSDFEFQKIVDIQKIDSVEKIIFGQKSYYYIVYSNGDNKLIILFDESGCAIGTLYFESIVDYDKFKQAKTLDDIKTLENIESYDELKIYGNSAIYLFSREGRIYDLDDMEMSNISLHLTSDGIYLLEYDNELLSNSNVKITNIKKINDSLYQSLFDSLCSKTIR